MTIERAADALASGSVTSRELLETCVQQADEHDARLGSFVLRCDTEARRAADEADARFAKGVRVSPLQGIPIGVKDNLTTQDMPTTAQTRALPSEWAPRVDAPVVERLRNAGAVLVGKTTLMEFALGMPDPSLAFPVPKNPWDESRWSGGSSSGTANGLASGFFLGGVGTDSGGSIRLPSAFCGITGLKPTSGLVSTGGCIPLAKSLDHVGPMARTARDCALLLAVMAGAPQLAQRAAQPLDAPLAGIRIAIEREHHVAVPGVDEGAAGAFEVAVTVLAELGATLAEISLPHYAELAAASQVVLLAEAFEQHRANLRRRWREYGVHTRDRLAHGAFFTDADYGRARRAHDQGREVVSEIFARHHVIACLTAGTGPERIDGLGLDGHISTAGVTFTRLWNPIGTPALSLPIGFTSDGLPVGMQLIGRWFDDVGLIRVADAFQQRTDWHDRTAPLQPAGRRNGI